LTFAALGIGCAIFLFLRRDGSARPEIYRVTAGISLAIIIQEEDRGC
jgi:hypothetical protein